MRRDLHGETNDARGVCFTSVPRDRRQEGLPPSDDESIIWINYRYGSVVLFTEATYRLVGETSYKDQPITCRASPRHHLGASCSKRQGINVTEDASCAPRGNLSDAVTGENRTLRNARLQRGYRSERLKGAEDLSGPVFEDPILGLLPYDDAWIDTVQQHRRTGEQVAGHRAIPGQGENVRVLVSLTGTQDGKCHDWTYRG